MRRIARIALLALAGCAISSPRIPPPGGYPTIRISRALVLHLPITEADEDIPAGTVLTGSNRTLPGLTDYCGLLRNGKNGPLSTRCLTLRGHTLEQLNMLGYPIGQITLQPGDAVFSAP